MVLDFEYGVNTANRFLDFVDHDEDPDVFLAKQTSVEEKKTSSKDSKQTSATASKKTSSKTTTTATTTPTTTTSATFTSKPSTVTGTTKTNKENVSGKSTSSDQRRQQSATVPAVFGDNNNQQQSRGDNNRGGRGGQRRGGYDRPPFEGSGRGGGQQQRSARFNKFEGQQGTPATNEPSGFEQGGDSWGTADTSASGSNDQSFRGSRGRGGPRRGNYEGGSGRGRGNYDDSGRGRGGGRGGRGGRGNYNNRPLEEGSQQQQSFQQDSNSWQPSSDTNVDNSRPATTRPVGQEFDSESSPQERPFEPDNYRRGGGGRGSYRGGRTFHNNRGNYGGDRTFDRESGEGGSHDEYRQNRRQYDRQPRTNVSSVKPIEKKDGEGAHNWGNPTENPEEHPITDETNEPTVAPSSKDWSQQVDEFEKQMTLDEYKKQQEAKKKANPLVQTQFKTRAAGEGEDPKIWQKPEVVYRKKNEDDESEGEGEESGAEEEGSVEEEIEEEQQAAKKKVITIPLRFKPIEVPRGPGGSRGGARRGGGRYDDRQPRSGGSGFRDRPPRDDDRQQPRSNSPSQQQPPSSQQTGDVLADEQATSPQQYYRGGQRGGGGSRQGSGGRGVGGDYRRSYANSSRGPRGSGQGRSGGDPNAPALDNPLDFPTLPKQ